MHDFDFDPLAVVSVLIGLGAVASFIAERVGARAHGRAVWAGLIFAAGVALFGPMVACGGWVQGACLAVCLGGAFVRPVPSRQAVTAFVIGAGWFTFAIVTRATSVRDPVGEDIPWEVRAAMDCTRRYGWPFEFADRAVPSFMLNDWYLRQVSYPSEAESICIEETLVRAVDLTIWMPVAIVCAVLLRRVRVPARILWVVGCVTAAWSAYVDLYWLRVTQYWG